MIEMALTESFGPVQCGCVASMTFVGPTSLDLTLLKVDTQGFEMPVFRGLGDWIREIRVILCEVSVNPLYAGTPMMTDVVTFLGSQGFKPAFFAPVSRMVDLSVLELIIFVSMGKIRSYPLQVAYK
jgi:hypothetical protein